LLPAKKWARKGSRKLLRSGKHAERSGQMSIQKAVRNYERIIRKKMGGGWETFRGVRGHEVRQNRYLEKRFAGRMGTGVCHIKDSREAVHEKLCITKG